MTKKHWLWLSGGLCIVAAVICLLLSLPQLFETQTADFAPTVTTSTSADSATSTTTAITTATTVAPYVSPIDFQGLQELNSDIYAWITVPGTSINYPIVQHAKDDTFYLDHDSDGNYSANGAIYSERLYNSTDFSDAVTVLYGHNMKSGAMFGELQSVYWDLDFLLENDDILIYLPDRELRFEIFAALPYSRMHLLYYYQTEKQAAFDQMIEDIYSTRTLSAILLEERRPEYGDQIVVLSTCLSGNNRYRYLVFGVCKGNN